MLKSRNKLLNGKLNTKDYINSLLVKSGIYYNEKLWFLNKITIVLLSITICICAYIIFEDILKLKLLTIIFSVTLASMPIFILKFIEDETNNKIEKEIINFIVKLKNQVNIHSDLIKSMADIVKYLEHPIKDHIDRFLFEIEKGLNTEEAFKNLKSKINNKEYNNLISNIENCYNFGGNTMLLLNSSQNIFSLRQRERVIRNEQTLSGRIVLIILIFLMLFVYFNFIRTDEQNFSIMINSIIGKIILYWNFISVWLLLILVILVKRMDE